jgi:type IX secretion system PorP/SprF family membrane protein
MMKKTLILLSLIPLLNSNVNAQHVPNSNQAYQFTSVYNPAFTGAESCGDLKLGYRYQWTGFGASAPKFLNLVYNLRLSRSKNYGLNSLRTSVQASNSKPSKTPIHAAGSNLFNEKAGIINRLGGGLNYAFHYPLFESRNIWLATGMAIMIENARVDVNAIYMGSNPDPDAFYDKLLSGGANRVDLNVRVGLLLYAPNFYFGFSYLPVWNHPLQGAEGNFAGTLYRGTAQAGVSFPLNEAFNLKPSVFGVWQTDNEVLLDYSLKVFYQERVWLGLAYRSISSGVGLIGMNLSKMFVATYSYEIPTSALRQFSNGSHELVLAIRLNNVKSCNPYVW